MTRCSRPRSRGRGAIALSLVAHAVGGAIAAASIVAKPVVAAVAKPTAVDEPIEVVMLDEPTSDGPRLTGTARPPTSAAVVVTTTRLVAPAAATTATPTSAARASTAAPAAAPTSATSATAAPSPTSAAIASATLYATSNADRAQPSGAPGMPSVRAESDRIDAHAPIAPAAPATPDEPLASAESRTTFTMRVEPDGTAHIRDRRNLQRARGHDYDLMAETSRAEQWLDAHHEQSNVVDTKMAPVGMTVLTFDVSDWALRSAGQDPYAFAKLKVLDATREQRAEIGARHRARQVVQTPALVRDSLAQIAALAPAERHAALVELWQSCDTSTAGAVARATIVRYVSEQAVFSAEDRAVVEQR